MKPNEARGTQRRRWIGRRRGAVSLLGLGGLLALAAAPAAAAWPLAPQSPSAKRAPASAVPLAQEHRPVTPLGGGAGTRPAPGPTPPALQATPPAPPPPAAPQLIPVAPAASGASATPRSSKEQAPRFPLTATPDGGYRYRDDRFEARIAPDGSVTFDDRRLLGPRPGAVAAPEPSPLQPTPYDDPARTEYRGEPPKAPVVQPVVGPGVAFDLTDEYRRLLGKNPHRDAQAQFLASTYDMRVRMAVEHASKQRRDRLDALPADLAAIWNNPARSRREKLQIVQLLWQELGDGPEAARAATIIETFARQRFTPEEAARFRR
jgi:hypothetical protein